MFDNLCLGPREGGPGGTPTPSPEGICDFTYKDTYQTKLLPEGPQMHQF